MAWSLFRNKAKKGNQMNKAELVDTISTKTGMTKADVYRVIDEFATTVKTVLSQEGELRLSNFGTFYTLRRKATTLRNPNNGSPVKVKAKTVARFRAGKGLKETVDGTKKYTTTATTKTTTTKTTKK
jgi:DNA-binding protein HU-beta